MATCQGACADLSGGIDPPCTTIKRVGGVAARIWVTQLSQIDSYTVNGSTLDIESISMCSTSPISTLYKFFGKKFKNSATDELQVGENINTFLQSFILILYFRTSLDKKRIEDLANAIGVVVFCETNAGDIEVYGIDTRGSASSSDPIGGLDASAGTGGTGIQLNDPTTFALTLSGLHRVMSRNFSISPTATLAENIAYLDALSA